MYEVSVSSSFRSLCRQWALKVQDLFYLPVGFGGYHWLVVDTTGS
jgi:hypothetical protein